MFIRLKTEMKSANITIAQAAAEICVTEKTFRNKLNGVTDFTWPEVLKIRRMVAPCFALEKLFAETNNTSNQNVCSA